MPKKRSDIKPVEIDWEDFQNKPNEFRFLKKILKLVGKYQGMGIADMVSAFKKDILSRDQINLAAMNVFLAVQAGRAEGGLNKAYGNRKAKIAEEEVDIRLNGMEDVDRVTDKLVQAEAEKRCKKHRMREAKATELARVFEYVMHRVNKLLDALENANKSLEAEHRRTK